jgi:hypothetical protein
MGKGPEPVKLNKAFGPTTRYECRANKSIPIKEGMTIQGMLKADPGATVRIRQE